MKIIKKYKYIMTIIILFIIIIWVIIVKINLNNKQYQTNKEEVILNNKSDSEELTEKQIPLEKCNIDIKGAINNPGVYFVDCKSTVNDIINLAGGLTENANTKITNLAKKVSDEMVIIIYTEEEIKNSNIVDTVIKVIDKECNCPNIQNDSCINTEIKDEITNDTSQKENDNLININTASLNELQELSGIGESKAKAIIEYRETNGNFKKIDELLNVSGIGNNLYEEIKDKIKI